MRIYFPALQPPKFMDETGIYVNMDSETNNNIKSNRPNDNR